MVLPCLLFVASFCLASARFPERAELSLAQVSVGSDGWIGPRLKGQDAAKVTEWIQQSNASEAYCKLLRHAGKCANLDCTECAENRKQEILDKVRIQILKKNQSRDPSQKPLAVFVLGAVASGKSTFIKESLEQHLDSDRSSFRSAVHINADELRSKMVGSSELYSALVNQKVSMQGSPGFRSLGSMIPDANKLRDKIQEMVLENRVDVIADSISIPVVVAKRFLEEGFQVKAFHIEVAEISDAARAKTAVGDIMRRVSRGGHLAPTYPAQIQSSRASAHKLGTEGIDISYLSRKGVKFLPAGRDSECHLAQDQQEREMEAIQFLKEIWLPGDSTPVTAPTTSNKTEAKFGDQELFSVTYNNAFVTALAIKHPPLRQEVSTVWQVSSALRCLPELNMLILDGAEIQGSLLDLHLPQKLTRLQMRSCDVEGSLQDLTKALAMPLTALKLAGKLIRGDLQDLNWTNLEFLDLQRASAVTGSLSDINIPEEGVPARNESLKGLWLQSTSVTGDITDLLRNNRNMTYLDLTDTQASGSINDEWFDVGRKIEYLRLRDSRVTFEMTDPKPVDKKENAMKPFPLLPRLDISGCPLNMDVWKLLKPLMYNNKLFALEASGCNLTGKVENMAQISARPSYFGLYILDLSKNNINALEGKPLDTCLYNLTGNPLEQISEHYFTMPGKLDIRATNFSSTRNGSIEWHSNHSKSWSELFDIANTSFTRNHSVCSWVTSVDNPRCELLVSPETFAPDRLCQCRDFYGGSGVDCIKCPGPSMKDPLNHTRRCCTCENGKARATIDNETDLRCFRCFGSGCEGRNCTAYCSVGHSGSLCRTCAENYAYAPRPHSLRCEKCAADARGGSRRLLMLLLAVVLIVVVSICQWWCVYRVQKRSSIERGQRTQEFIDQSLLMVTFVQLLQMVHASIASSSRQTVLDAGSAAGGFQILLTAAQLRIADALRLLNVQCYFEQEYGLFLERLSSAFLLPGICLVAMCVGACRHSVFLALRNCILLMKLLFIGTIEVTLSNLACITADADREKLPPEAHFLKEFPWTRCDALGAPLRLALWLAFVLNALLLPLSFVILAWYMNRQVQPLWSWCRWLRPNFSAGPKGFTLWWGVPPGALEGDGCPEQYLSMLRKSSQVFLAAHAACLLPGLGLPETLDITTSLQKAAPDVGEMPESEQGKHRTNLVVECETKDGWVDMSPSRLERLLSGAREEAMALGDMLLYRQASHQVLKRSLWIGARSAFESFATTDPLLFVGLDKVVVLAITSLCLKKDLAGVATFFGILAVGILRAQPYGTRSRNHLGFACCLALAGYSLCLLLALSIWHDPEWALGTGARFAACAGPFCCYLHLQLAPADMTIEAYKLLAHLKGFDSEKGAGQSYMSAEGSSAAVAAPDSLPDHEVLHVPAAPPAAWTFEQRWPVRWLFHGYRLRIRPWLLSPCVQLLEEVESRALRGVGEVVQRVGGRNTVDGIEMSEVSSLRSRSCGPV